MKAKDLIVKLQELDPDTNVSVLWTWTDWVWDLDGGDEEEVVRVGWGYVEGISTEYKECKIYACSADLVGDNLS